MNFTQLLLKHHEHLKHDAAATVTISGSSLTLASVVALSRHRSLCDLDPEALDASGVSATVVRQSLDEGHVIYGVNTGFGGSAGTRTQAIEELQRKLMRGLHYGIMSEPTLHSIFENEDLYAPCMPESWARASMAIRLNSLISGSSGVERSTVEVLRDVLNADIVPRIPLRGSISASGDLSPLSYIGGTMQGKPSISVFFGDRLRNERAIVSAHTALRRSSITPVILKAKEGLAVTNGTAVSAGVAALALNDTILLHALSQILTAMSVEALRGTDESFDPYFALVRPHPGQQESAHCIFHFLRESSLVTHNANLEEASLRQDRYSIRTASQWSGPSAEDLLAAHAQITVELNSATDNPLIDPATKRVLHGGNFQARSVAAACDRLRAGVLQPLGRMLSVQCTEAINPALNNGLPPNLVADEPSTSFIWKGTDIMVAALTSELGFLANPVGSHVQSAEMGNQALNSLALVSARYTHNAVDCLAQMAAAHLVALCQALDLRAMQARFLQDFRKTFVERTVTILKAPAIAMEDVEGNMIVEQLWQKFVKAFESSSSIDSHRRFTFIMDSLESTLQRHVLKLSVEPPLTKPTEIASSSPNGSIPSSVVEIVRLIRLWIVDNSIVARNKYLSQVELVSTQPDATPFLGRASRKMYTFVRQNLGVPFIREETISTPAPETELEMELAESLEPADTTDVTDVTDAPDKTAAGHDTQGLNPNPKPVPVQAGSKMGDYITKVYDSIRTGGMLDVVAEIYAEVRQ